MGYIRDSYNFLPTAIDCLKNKPYKPCTIDQVKVDAYPVQQLGKTNAQLQALSMGTQDICFGSLAQSWNQIGIWSLHSAMAIRVKYFFTIKSKKVFINLCKRPKHEYFLRTGFQA